MQFLNEDFIFDNVRSRDMNIKLISTDDIFSSVKTIGVQQNIIEEKIKGIDTPFFYGVERQPPTIPITITRATNDMLSLPFTQVELFKIERWLFKNEYKPFVSYDNRGIVYYVIFTKGEGYMNGLREGYIKLDMRLNSPYAYSILSANSLYVNGTKRFSLENGSNVVDFIYPNIEFELLENTTDLTIKNLTTGQMATFTGLTPNEKIYVDNSVIKSVTSKIDKNRNIFEKFNKEWFKLVYGQNIIEITGKAKMNFYCEYPLGLM